MIKGINVTRPYTPTGLTTDRWIKEVSVEEIPVSEIVLTQNHFYIEAILYPKETKDKYIHVVLYKGDYYLEDGHHRLLTQILTKQEKVQARVYNYPV